MSISFAKSARAQDCLNFILEWTHALNGSNSISDVLERLLHLANAEAALIVRVSKPANKVNYVARCCVQKGKAFPVQPQTQAEYVLGDWSATAKAGSIWKSSDMREDTAPISRLPQVKPTGVEEVVVVPFETKADHVDFLELHYSQNIRANDIDLLSILAPTLASGWSRRIPGTISARLEQGRGHRLRAVRSELFIPILNPQNPANLSRCEFRICAMMKEGMTVKKISQSLSVSPTTVRSHLSSIFAKTGVSNQVELLHQLNRKAKPQGDFEGTQVARAG